MGSAYRSPKKKLNVIYWYLAEGSVTEPLYIDFIRDILRRAGAGVLIEKIRTGNGKGKGKTDAKNLLIQAKRFSKKMEKGDHICIICDKDEWPLDDLDNIRKWAEGDLTYRHVAITDPCFEAWLLLHFEHIAGRDRGKILEALVAKRVYMDRGDKEPKMSLFNIDNVRGAIARARSLEKSTGQGFGIAQLIDEWFTYIKNADC